jgi:ankyrin repeat protein
VRKADRKLFEAVSRGDVAAAERDLLTHGASASYTHLQSGPGREIRTPVLYVACERRDRAAVELLLAHGANPDACREDRSERRGLDDKPCLIAAFPSVEIVRLLLEKGASPNVCWVRGESRFHKTPALEVAIGNGHHDIVGLLRQHGAVPDVNRELFEAVSGGDVPAAERALLNGASARYVHVDDGPGCHCNTPVLYVACQRHDRSAVELLLAHGADPNVAEQERAAWGSHSDPCLIAAFPSADIVRLLLQKGANPNVCQEWREDCNNESSALQIAIGHARSEEAGNAYQEIVALLTQHGARRSD